MNSASRIVHRSFQKSLKSLERSEVFNATLSSRKTKKGDPTSLSISSLPIIKREVKNRLTRQELCSLQEFELETYTIELAHLDYSYFKNWTSEDLIVAILSTLRREPRFWIPDSEVHSQIESTGVYVPKEEDLAEDQSVEDDQNIPYAVLRSHIEASSETSLFAANRFMRVPRLPVVIFPMIFQYVKKHVSIPTQAESYGNFYLQNLIQSSLLRAKHYFRIELNNREINNYQKNEKFRRNIRAKDVEFRCIKSFDEQTENLLRSFNDFCKAEGMNLQGIFDKYHEMRSKEEELLAYTLQYCITGLVNFLDAPGPASHKSLQMSKRKLDNTTAFFHYDTTPTEFSYDTIDHRKASALEIYIWHLAKTPHSLLNLPEEKISLMGRHFLEFYESEGQKRKRSYRYFSDERPVWTDKDYVKFYEAVEKFNDEPLANKRIAKYMGKHIDPNHVRYERQEYNKKRKLGLC